jgi:hypothetical protein
VIGGSLCRSIGLVRPAWLLSRIGLLLAGPFVVAASALSASADHLPNPSAWYTFEPWGCGYQGSIYFTGSPPSQVSTSIDWANCSNLTVHVHGWFWGSDSQWHYEEDNRVNPQCCAIAIWSYWTDNIYGYHNLAYGSSISTTAETHEW